MLVKFDRARFERDLPFKSRTELFHALRVFDDSLTEDGVYKLFRRGPFLDFKRLCQILVVARLKGRKLDIWDYIEVRVTRKETA